GLDGVTVITPDFKADVLHAHNRLVFTSRPSLISFESFLPRRFALTERNPLARAMERHIRRNSVRRLVAMSHFAARIFRKQHRDAPGFEALDAKLMVRHPALEIGEAEDRMDLAAGGPLRLLFVGAHFARKGGCVAARMAQLAAERKLPLEVVVISSMQMGGGIWTDPVDPEVYAPYLKALEGPNVTVMGAQPNAVVRAELGRSHFSLLATLADTFGYSAIESMAEHTPVIGTEICALPEFITDGVNGLTLPLDSNDVGQWAHLDHTQLGEASYAKRFCETVDQLAETALARLAPYFEAPERLAPLRAEARRTAVTRFDAAASDAAWDALYSQIATEDPRTTPKVLPGDYLSPERYAPGG
ncbi:MAG: glycosyltransferase family 4 protein, partial [Pseudomonadota bacterium]